MPKTYISVALALVVVLVGSWYLAIHLLKAPQPVANNLSRVYSNNANGFSLRLPDGYTVDEAYRYEMTPERNIGGVKFTIPASLADGTNLGHDTYLSIERLSGLKECSASAFFYDATVSKMLTENSVAYLVASSTGAGAGNRYEETVYAIAGTNPCLAVRYFIHYSVFENYPAGTVREFDKQALLKQFDQMRSSLVLK